MFLKKISECNVYMIVSKFGNALVVTFTINRRLTIVLIIKRIFFFFRNFCYDVVVKVDINLVHCEESFDKMDSGNIRQRQQKFNMDI